MAACCAACRLAMDNIHTPFLLCQTFDKGYYSNDYKQSYNDFIREQ